jgi:hypothetical protein
VLATPSASEVSSAGVARAPRLTEEGDRAERLSRLRARDARLDAAAEAFDLELLE